MRNVKRRAALVLAVLAAVTAFAGPAHADDGSLWMSAHAGFVRGR